MINKMDPSQKLQYDLDYVRLGHLNAFHVCLEKIDRDAWQKAGNKRNGYRDEDLRCPGTADVSDHRCDAGTDSLDARLSRSTRLVIVQHLFAVAFDKYVIIACARLVSLSFCEAPTRVFRIVAFNRRMDDRRSVPDNAVSSSSNSNPNTEVKPNQRKQGYEKQSK